MRIKQKIFHRGDTENTEFFVRAKQKPIIHRGDTESTEFVVGAEDKPITHRGEAENVEFIHNMPEQSLNQISGITGRREVCL